MKPTERVLSFGAAGALHGVLTEPQPSRRLAEAPAVLSWNVGLHHHVGPHRFFVDLSRALAEAGFTSLRFDISGLGDSEVSRDDARPDSARAVSDVRTAMAELMAQRGFKTFVPVGFCSGVDAAHAIGVNDASVAGVVYLEGYGFRTPGFYLRYPKRFVDPNRWERLLRIKYPWLFGEAASERNLELERERVYLRDYPSREKLRADVRAMLDRGTRLLLVYVGGDTDYAYREQFFEMIGAETSGQLEVEFYPHADHTFFLESDRKQVVQRVVAWMKAGFDSAQLGEPRPERAGATANGARAC